MAQFSAHLISTCSRILLGTFIGLTATLLNDELGHARNNPAENHPSFGCIGGKITSMLGEDSKIKERLIEQILNPSDEYHRTEAIKSYWGLIRKSERIDSMDSRVGIFLRNDPTIDPVRIGFTGLILRKLAWLGGIAEQPRGINDPLIVSRLLLGFYNGFDRGLSSEIARALRHENAKDLFESCSTELWSGKASSRDEPFLERVVSAENQSPVGDLERAIQESRTEVEGVRKLSVGSDSKGVFLYQAYSPLIAEEAMTLQRFGSSFSFSRMTWFKVSFGSVRNFV